MKNVQAPGSGAAGFSLIEVLVVVFVIAIMTGLAAPSLYGRDYHLWQAQAQLLSDLRNARGAALTSGDHFRVRIVGSDTYEVHRLRFIADVWTPDADPIHDRALPTGVYFSSAVGSTFEFTTRGLLVNGSVSTVVELSDSRTSIARDLTVWPSGQVIP